MNLTRRILPVKYRVASKNPRVGFVSLGCPKALVDSERILTQLRAEGYVIAPGYDDADVVIVNTCSFIDSSKEESIDHILEVHRQRGLAKRRKHQKLIVAGCLIAARKHVEATVL